MICFLLGGSEAAAVLHSLPLASLPCWNTLDTARPTALKSQAQVCTARALNGAALRTGAEPTGRPAREAAFW